VSRNSFSPSDISASITTTRNYEKAWIAGELEREKRERVGDHPDVSILRGFASAAVVVLWAGYFFIWEGLGVRREQDATGYAFFA
jgi:hypothetical protein